MTLTHPFDIIMVPMQILIFLFTLYFFVIGFCGMWRRKENKIKTPKKTFALVVAAHNEEVVIGDLVENLKQLNYPKDMYDIYVIADNCTDNTAKIASDAGALVHVRTQKGHGYAPAEREPWKFHGVGPFDAATGAVPPAKESFSSVFGAALTELAEEDPRVCAITAAMEDGTGLTPFAGRFPDRFFDVGIAEGHAAAMAAGLAKQGALPVFAVYSSFLQRAYDQLLHDVALSGLHVVFAVDRAGLVGADGATHHGVMDTVFLSGIPNMTVLCPASFAELRAMLRRALFEMTGPVAIRYPRGGEGAFTADTSAGDFAELRTGKDITLCAYGTLINNVLGAAELLHEDGIEARVVKLNRISPFRGGELSRIFGTTKRLLVAEECSGVGCIGQRIAAILAEEGHEPQRLMLCNLGRRFIEQGSVGELYRQCGLDAESLARTAKEVCQ